MADENIGSIAVSIVGDYSQLQGDIDAAAQVAQKGGEEIASALNAGAESADALSGAISAASVGMGSFEAQIQALVDTGSTLAEALAAVGTAAAETATGVEQAGAAAATAAEQLSLFDDAASVPFADAAGQLNLFATELEPIAPAAEAAATGLHDLHDAEAETVPETQSLMGLIGELGENFKALAEAFVITEGLKEFGAEALSAADNITHASIALTTITGSARVAEETIKGLEQLGIADGLAMPSLLTAATRMQQLLGAGTDVVPLLKEIADGASVMHTDIGAAADMFDRMAANGVVMARSLGQIGLTMQGLATAVNDVNPALNATATNLTKVFKTMDQTDRIAALQLAFQNLGGVAQQVAEQTFGGEWQSLSNEFEQIMAEVGKAILPVISDLVDLMKTDIVPWIKDAVDAFNQLPEPVKDVAVAVGLLAAALPPLFLAVGAFGLALNGVQEVLPIFTSMLEAVGLKSAAAAAGETALAAATEAESTALAGFAASEEGAAGLAASLTGGILALAAGFAALALNIGGVADKMGAWLDKQGVNLADWIEGLVSGAPIAAVMAKSMADSMDHLGQSAGGAKEQLLYLQPAFTGFTATMSDAAIATQAAGLKMQGLQDAVKSTHDALVAATADYNATGQGANQVAAAYDKWQSATNALKSAQDALLPVVTSIHHEFVELAGAYKLFDQSTLEVVTDQQAAADKADALNAIWQAQQVTLDHAKANLDAVIDEYDRGVTTWQKVQTALTAVNQAQAAVDKGWQDFFNSIAPANNTMQALAANVNDAASDFEHFLLPIQQAPAYVETATDVLRRMGITVDSTGQSVTKLIGIYDDLAGTNPTLEQEDIAWAKISGQVEKLAKTDLPAALALYDRHIAQIKESGAAEGELLAAESGRLQIEIKIDEQAGASATKQIIALNNIRIQQQLLYDQTHLLGDMYVGVFNDILKGFDSLGKGIADNIIDEKNWGDMFVSIGKQIAKTILEEIVGTAFKALEDAILKSMLGVSSLGDSFKNLGSTIKSAFSGAPSTGAMQGPPAINPDGSLAGGAPGGATGAASGIGGAISSIATIATAITSIISGIVSGVQQAHMESDLQKIEKSTRFAEIYLGEQGDSILNTAHLMRDSLTTMVDEMQGMVAINLSANLTTQQVNTILNGLVNGSLGFYAKTYDVFQEIYGSITAGTAQIVGQLQAIYHALNPSIGESILKNLFGGLGGITSGIGGAISGIGGSLISGLTSLFGGGDKAQGRIEENTRFARIYLGEQGDSILYTVHIIRDTLNEKLTGLLSVTDDIKDRFDDVRDVLGDIRNGLAAGIGGATPDNSGLVQALTDGFTTLDIHIMNGLGAIAAHLANISGTLTQTLKGPLSNLLGVTETATQSAQDQNLATTDALTLLTYAITDSWGRLTDQLTAQFDSTTYMWTGIQVILTSIAQALTNIPKLASGTAFVQSDMLAYIHQGEAVIPPGGLQTIQSSLASAQTVTAFGAVAAAPVGTPITLDTFSLNTSFPSYEFPGVPERSVESQYTPYMGGVIPGLPGVPQPVAAPSTPTAVPTGGTAGTVSNVFNIIEAMNPRETARQIANTLKTLSPRFVVYNQ